MSQFTFEPIGYVHSPYQQKFAIPRQPRLVNAAVGFIELVPPYNNIDTLRGLDAFSHLWIQFIFHETAGQGWKSIVRPPRLGGNTGKGVFATRSTFRPNPIGLSAVELINIEAGKIFIRGLDLLNGTPVLDIKPYLPYADSIDNAKGGYADDRPNTDLHVEFTDTSLRQLETYRDRLPELRLLIEQVLQQDPRPGYHAQSNLERTYGMHLYDLNIQWQVRDNCCIVLQIS